MAAFSSWPSFSDACGSASDVLDGKRTKNNSNARIRASPSRDKANPQEISMAMKDGNGGEDHAHVPGSASVGTPNRKMTTNASDYYHQSANSSRGGGSGVTNPNQSPREKQKRLVTPRDRPRDRSPFQEAWQRFSPPSMQALEEGKQILQRKFASFFDDACAHSSCNNYEDPTAPDEEATPLTGASTTEPRYNVVSPGNDTVTTARRSGTVGVSDKATAAGHDGDTNTNPELNVFRNGDKQRSALGRAGMSGTVRGGVRDRKSSRPLPKNSSRRESPISVATHERIEVNSEQEVKVIEPAPSSAVPSVSRKPSKRAPIELLEVRAEDAYELERSISELTMRSSYGGGESMANIPDNRRMAYYAVGKNHRQSGRGGNRRCYFSGKLILGGTPFYAGAVQQGLRTLVVFCLPSAVNLPDREMLLKWNKTPARKHSRSAGSSLGNDSSNGSGPGGGGGILRDASRATRSVNSRSLTSRSADKRPARRGLRGLIQNNNSMNNDGANSVASRSRMSSLDDLSLSIDGDLDPNWGLDRDLLLEVLPEADEKLLETMSKMFPEQFETLPIQVRDAKRWRLYVKFCFFSGLPIAEGEMHYKVFDELAEQVYGEEIVLSHDVMEAVNGDVSAEILQLPNQKVFRYLRKHYAQQCSKLDDRVFRRGAWIRVAPEI